MYILAESNDQELELGHREKMILQYLKEFPGSSKADVVRAVDHLVSRVTALNLLLRMEQQKLITVKLQKPNSQIYKLYVNDSNLLSHLILELHDMEFYFSRLIDQVCYLQDQMLKDHPNTLDKNGNGDIFFPNLALKCFDIFLDVVTVYNYRLIILWPQYVRDQPTIDKASQLVTSTMNKIRNNLFNSFEHYYKRLGFVDTKGNKKKGLIAVLDEIFLAGSLLERILTLRKDPVIHGAEDEMQPILKFIKKLDPKIEEKYPLFDSTFDHFIEKKDLPE